MPRPHALPRTLALACALAIGAPPFTEARAEGLAAVYAIALERDPNLAAQRASAAAVSERIEAARADAYRPIVSGRGGLNYNYQDITVEGSDVFSGGNIDFDGRSWSITLTQPLYRRDRLERLKQVASEVREQELLVDAALQGLARQVVQRYFDVLAAGDDLTFARAEKAAFARRLEESRSRFEVGLVAVTDVQEAQSAHDLAVAQEIAAENAVDEAEEALREILGETLPALDALGEELPLARPDPLDVEAWTAQALEQNPTVAAALAAAESADRGIAVARAEHHPTIDAIGSVGYDRSGGLFGNNETQSAQVGVQLEVPLYTGGGIDARTREASFRARESQDRVEERRRAVQREARNAYNAVVAGVSRIAALAQAIVSARTALEAIQAGFEVGTRTTVDVVTAERDVYRALRDHARARYDYLVDTIRLREAAGTLVVDDLVAIDAWLTRR